MKRSLIMLLAMLAGVPGVSGVAFAATTCTGFLPAGSVASIVVPAGESCTITGPNHISGSVTVGAGANLRVTASAGNVTIAGNVTGKGCESIEVDYGGSGTERIVIGGNLDIENCTGGFNGCRGTSGQFSATNPPASVLIGGNFTCVNSGGFSQCVTDDCTIAGNLNCSGNTDGCAIPGTTIGGDAKLTNNGGSGVSIGNTTIGGNLSCSGNSAVSGSGNTVAGTESGQCAGL